MRLLPDWKDAWRWWSVRVYALIAALPVIWEALPPEVIVLLPAEWRMWILVGLAVIGAGLRVVDQGRAE